VALSAPNGFYLAVDPSSGAVLANGAQRNAGVVITVHAELRVAAQPALLAV
jgi:hypothetical protein